jgi:hypothetical protein
MVVVAAIGLQAQHQVPSIAADVVTFHRLSDGRVIHVDGHYYRNREGKVREDSGNGAVIVDTNAHRVTILNFETKEAHVMKVPGNQAHPAMDVRTSSGHGNVEGHKVSKMASAGPHGEKLEAWSADDLGLTVFTRSQSSNMTMTKYVRNIKVEEPDPSLFEIPSGYTIRKLDAPASGPPQLPELPPAKGKTTKGGGR